MKLLYQSQLNRIQKVLLPYYKSKNNAKEFVQQEIKNIEQKVNEFWDKITLDAINNAKGLSLLMRTNPNAIKEQVQKNERFKDEVPENRRQIDDKDKPVPRKMCFEDTLSNKRPSEQPSPTKEDLQDEFGIDDEDL